MHVPAFTNPIVPMRHATWHRERVANSLIDEIGWYQRGKMRILDRNSWVYQRIAARSPKDLGIDQFNRAPMEEERSWDNFPRTVSYQCDCIFPGSVPDGEDWFEKQVHQHLLAGKKARKLLSLGCGYGRVERRLMRLGIAEECLGVDIADMAIRSAQADAEKAGLSGLSYAVADLDNIDLPKSTYDVVWVNGALHHLDRLERIVRLSHSCLIGGGVFVAREVVGPDHQQLSPRALEVVNSVLHLIPQRYRRVSEINRLPQWALSRPGRRNLYALWRLLTLRPMHFREDVQRAARGNKALAVYAALCPTRKKVESGSTFRFGKLYDNDRNYFEFIDPTEGVHSSEILPTIQRVFGDADVRYYNGALISCVFGTLNEVYFDDYNAKRGSACEVMEALIYLDRAMTLSGEIPASYAAIFATKR